MLPVRSWDHMQGPISFQLLLSSIHRLDASRLAAVLALPSLPGDEAEAGGGQRGEDVADGE